MPLPRGAVECTLVADPELRFSPSGVAVASMRLVATDRRFNKENNEWEDGDKLWFDATCFKQLAENTVETVGRGDRVIVTGKWKTDEWEDRDTGAKRSKITFICDVVAPSLVFATAKVSRASRSSAGSQSSTPRDTPSTSSSNDPWASPNQADEPPF